LKSEKKIQELQEELSLTTLNVRICHKHDFPSKATPKGFL